MTVSFCDGLGYHAVDHLDPRTMRDIARDLHRDMLAVLFIGALIGVSFWILRPFLGAMVWAAMIVVATWPAMVAVQARLWGKWSLAVTVMTLVLLLVLILPFLAVIGTIVANVDTIADWVQSLATDTQEGKMNRLTPQADQIIQPIRVVVERRAILGRAE